MKTCPACKQSKPISDFPPNKKNKDGLNIKCRVCFNAYMKEWYAKNKEKHKARVYSNPRQASSIRRPKRYGLTQADVDVMLSKFDGLCHLCKKKPAVCIDHCHKTNVVRGLLCHGCNSGLGKLGDSIEGLQRAIDYLSP